MKLSQHGEDLIVTREGEVLKVYRDSKGLPTMGVGHLLTSAEKIKYPLGTRITKEFSRALFRRDLADAENAILSLVKVPLKQNQYDALLSLIFNIGVANFRKSTVLKRLNEKDYVRAGKAILLWSQPPELADRRKKEYTQFITPYPSLAPDPVPVITTDPVSDPTGGGANNTPSNPPPVFSREKANQVYESAMGVTDKIADAQGRISRIPWRAGMGMKILGGIMTAAAFFQENWEFAVAAAVLVAIGLTIWYVSYRRNKKSGN